MSKMLKKRSLSFDRIFMEPKRRVDCLRNRFFSFRLSNEDLVGACDSFASGSRPPARLADPLVVRLMSIVSLFTFRRLSNLVVAFSLPHVVGRLGTCYATRWCIPLHPISHDF
jgi:hypothetical protein